MTSIFTKIIDQYRMAIQQFMNHGYLDYYKFLYGSSQFPFWFVFQAIYSCYISHKNIENSRKTPTLIIRQFITAFCMTFAPREIFAYLFKKLSPIIHNPQSVIIFFGIYGLLCLNPIYKFINIFRKWVGMVQGFNVARFFTLSLRNIKGIPVELILPTAIIFSVMDQLFEIVFRMIFRTKESEISNKNTIMRAAIFNAIYWIYTHPNYFTQYIGLHSVYFPGLILALVLSVSNSTYSIFRSDHQQPPPDNANDDLESENKRLKSLFLQLQSKSKEDHDKLTAEIERLKLELFEEQQKAKEDHDKLTTEIERLKNASNQ